MHGNFYSWKGMLVIGADNVGIGRGGNPQCADPPSGLWFGRTEDLWKLGKPETRRHDHRGGRGSALSPTKPASPPPNSTTPENIPRLRWPPSLRWRSGLRPVTVLNCRLKE
jgi:hypothetical protein